MKIFTAAMKILAALAAIAGVVYIVATYGDKIVAWAKKILGVCECECVCDCDDDCDECPCEDDCDECPCTCECECEDVTEEAVAEESDFEG